MFTRISETKSGIFQDINAKWNCFTSLEEGGEGGVSTAGITIHSPMNSASSSSRENLAIQLPK